MVFDEIYESILFKHVDKQYVRNLFKETYSVQLKAGEFLFHQGIIGRGMYFIISGSVDILLEMVDADPEKEVQELIIATLKPFAFIGEVCFLTEGKRTASVKAREKTEVIYLDNAILFQGFEEKNINAFQLAINIGRQMAGYLQSMNERLVMMYKVNAFDMNKFLELKVIS